MRKIALLLGCVLLTAARHRAALPPPASTPLDIRRSMVITDPAILDGFDFERVLRNPNPSAGAAGCRAVAQFWADLSGVDSMTERRARMEHFFYDGIDGFVPVLRPAHFVVGTGRIRTSQRQPGAPSGIGRF